MKKNSFAFLSVKSFRNSQQFLQNYYLSRKRADPDFSYETWAQELGFKNRSYLRLVVVGERPVNAALLKLFSEHFDFQGADAEYFSHLVHFTQSKNQEHRTLLGKKLLSLSCDGAELKDVEQHYEFLSDPTLPLLQTLRSFQDAPEETQALAELLEVPESKVASGLRRLEEMGLLKNLKPVSKSWRVPAAHQALGHQEFYREGLKKAQESIDLPFELRRFRSLFVALDETEFADFLQDFEVFVKEQLTKRNVDQLRDRRLYQLNFNFFPTSKPFKDV